MLLNSIRVLSVLALAGAAFAGQITFTITDLGADIAPTGLNNLGQVVGGSNSGGVGAPPPFLWTAGVVQSLGGYPQAINDLGEIVGATAGVAAILGSDGSIISLGLLSGGNGDPTLATALNNSGVVVGFSGSGGSREAFLFNGTLPLQNISSYPGGIVLNLPKAINSAGQIVGLTLNPSAYVFSGGTVTDIGSLPGATDNAISDINDAGHVVGHVGFGSAGLARPALWAPQASVLPTISGCDWIYTYAYALNNSDQIVGQATCGTDTKAILWIDSLSYDLYTLVQNGAGWQLSEATNINDQGQIIGRGTLNGVEHGFLLTPVTESAPVPEPSPIVPLALIAASCAIGRGRKLLLGLVEFRFR